MRILIGVLIVLLTACAESPPAPVIDRSPGSKSKTPVATATPTGKNTDAGKDWRPDSHIVKKGDTLYSIGLEYGIDYQEIAAANQIAPPYPIHIGQKLDLSSFKTKAAPADASKSVAGNHEAASSEGDVVITPMQTEPAVVGEKAVVDDTTVNEKPTTSAVTPVLSEPKAIREPYSLEALNRVPAQTTTVAMKPSETTPAEAAAETKTTETTETKSSATEPNVTSATGDEAITWAWPTQGKISASFNEASNKGIDIAGKPGQAINASSAGKVIYSGSDLRGYGKLVIVKHNKTYLSVYAHNSKIVVKEGQNVVSGQKIAEMGSTDSDTPKLHFEIRRLGKPVDPGKYLN